MPVREKWNTLISTSAIETPIRRLRCMPGRISSTRLCVKIGGISERKVEMIERKIVMINIAASGRR